MQKTDNHVYREQRRIPKNISPQDSDNHAGKLKLVEAPRSHEMTRRYLHDCEYADIGEIRVGMKEAAKLKKNLYSNRIPFKTETINAPPLLPAKEAAPRPDIGKGKAPLRASPHNADQGPPTRRKLEDHDRQGRTPLDYRLVQRNQSPPSNTPQNRYADSDGTVHPGDPARDRATHSGPMTDSDFRDKYDSSFRDKSMSSDRSRDSRLREGPKERIEPSRNRDPRDRGEQRNRSYSSLQRAPFTKGKGARAPSTASAFPKFCHTHSGISASRSPYLRQQKPKPRASPTIT